MRTTVWAATAAAFLVACSSEPEEIRYTCDLSQVPGLLTCTQFGPMDDYGVSYNEWYCSQHGGVWGQGLPCPTANLVASCQMPDGGTLQFWYEGATDLAGIESQCTTYGGTWTNYAP